MRGHLVGRTVVRSDFRVPQLATADLGGRTITAFDSYGKHMLTRFSGGLTLHTHFKMDGAWQVVGPGKRLPRTFDDEIRLVLHTDGPTAYALRMPVLELVATAREDDVVGHLGPDLLGTSWDEDAAVERLLRDPGRPLVEALLDQKNLAGIGNLWAVETCYLRGHSPWTPVRDVDLRATVRLARRMLQHSLDHPGQVTTGNTRRGQTHWVLRQGRAALPTVRHAGRLPGLGHRHALLPRDLVVPALPARALPVPGRAPHPTGDAARCQRGVLRLARPAAARRGGVRATTPQVTPGDRPAQRPPYARPMTGTRAAWTSASSWPPAYRWATSACGGAVTR